MSRKEENNGHLEGGETLYGKIKARIKYHACPQKGQRIMLIFANIWKQHFIFFKLVIFVQMFPIPCKNGPPFLIYEPNWPLPPSQIFFESRVESETRTPSSPCRVDVRPPTSSAIHTYVLNIRPHMRGFPTRRILSKFEFIFLCFRALSKVNSVAVSSPSIQQQSPDRMCEKMKGSLIKKQVRKFEFEYLNLMFL